MTPSDAFAQLKFRDPARARGLRDALDRLVKQADHAPVSRGTSLSTSECPCPDR